MTYMDDQKDMDALRIPPPPPVKPAAYVNQENEIVYGGKVIKPLVTSKTFPTDAAARKRLPVWSGVIKYFPDAIVGVSEVSWEGNQQHNPGEPLHWAKEKSKDHEDAMLRHAIEQIPDDAEGLYAAKQMAWRALAIVQMKIERMRNAERKNR